MICPSKKQPQASKPLRLELAVGVSPGYSQGVSVLRWPIPTLGGVHSWLPPSRQSEDCRPDLDANFRPSYGASGRRAHHVEVNATVDAVNSSVAVELPDEPSIDVRTKKESAVPQGTVELVADCVRPLEVVPDVQDDFAPPGFLDEADEITELFLDLGRTGSGTAVTGQLKIDGGREGIASGRSDAEKMTSLVGAGRAQSEVMVGASIQARVFCSAPVLIEAGVGEVAALGGLDVRERDAVSCDASPIDDVLMS